MGPVRATDSGFDPRPVTAKTYLDRGLDSETEAVTHIHLAPTVGAGFKNLAKKKMELPQENTFFPRSPTPRGARF